MNRKEFAAFLRKNKGYLRWGSERLAEKCNINPTAVEFIKNRLKNGENPLQNQKVLVYDLETSPIITAQWSLRQKYTNLSAIKYPSYLICWSGKWLFDDKMIEYSVTPTEAKNKDDERIVKSLWNYFDEADYVITYNGKSFDEKKANGRFLKYNLPLPSPYKHIDVYRSLRKKVKLESLKLDYITQFLGIEGKDDTSMQLWMDCMEGDKKALNKMLNYCSQDVKILETLYLQTRHYYKNHPSMVILDDKQSIKKCPTCSSEDIKEDGYYNTYTNSYTAYRCNNCQSLSRCRNSNIDTESKKQLIKSI